MKDKTDSARPGASFIIGAIALVFLIIGYQSALFIRQAAATRIVADHDRPDTVYIVREAGPAGDTAAVRSFRKESPHTESAVQVRRRNAPPRRETFPFDPNTVSIDDLMRLGFTEKQAVSIDNYRKKGGRFRRPADFARSYVVDDETFRRLEPYIDIPKTELNTADSAAFDALPGIGPFFASKMVSYRRELGGYSYPEQLMDIWHFDQEKYDGLKDLVYIREGSRTPYPLWTLDEQALALHPYIDKRAAHGIILYRDNQPEEEWTVEGLVRAGVLTEEQGGKLARCAIKAPASGPGMMRKDSLLPGR